MSGDGKPIVRPRKSLKSASPASNPSYKKQLEKDRECRGEIVLWKAPVLTLVNFAAELLSILSSFFLRLFNARLRCSIALAICALLYLFYVTVGVNSAFVQEWRGQVFWGAWWVWLGVLSSVGLGTGLHTFLLFLGPFIAKVTLTAYQCGTTDFPQPPYPNEIVCPEDAQPGLVTFWSIMSKVRFPAFCWGAGTALGELPPYFMARAARLSGTQDEDDEDLAEFEELLATKNDAKAPTDLLTRGKLFMHNLVQKVGFFGILAAASIPNPLFDLAGITCGHFLIPFWTFFGATLIGKAIVKMHIQKLFIIFLFSKQSVEILLKTLKRIPVIGETLHDPLSDFLEKQQQKLHSGSDGGSGGNLVGQIFEIFIILMVAYFVVTLVNSLAQSRVARKQKLQRDKNFNKTD